MERHISGVGPDLSMMKRVGALEKFREEHDGRISALENGLDSLKNSMTGNTSSGEPAAPLDISQLNMKINIMQEDLKKKADKTEVQHQASIV